MMLDIRQRFFHDAVNRHFYGSRQRRQVGRRNQLNLRQRDIFRTLRFQGEL